MTRLSVSNIAWPPEYDIPVYEHMAAMGFTGLEIAPTRVFPETPYERLDEAAGWAAWLRERYGVAVSSMQSVWYGRRERLFGSVEERRVLEEYTKKAIDLAAAVGCGNIVFGCPVNRNIGDRMSRAEADSIAVPFFRRMGEYACSRGTVIGLEANPVIYETDYINRTSEALELIRMVDSAGFGLNLDIGTMIENGESVEDLTGNGHLINHVHISEPGLQPIRERRLHGQLCGFLKRGDYRGYISIEMGKREDISEIKCAMRYIKEIFEDR